MSMMTSQILRIHYQLKNSLYIKVYNAAKIGFQAEVAFKISFVRGCSCAGKCSYIYPKYWFIVKTMFKVEGKFLVTTKIY